VVRGLAAFGLRGAGSVLKALGPFWPVRSGWHFDGKDWRFRSRVRKRLNEQLKAERRHRGGPRPIETVVGRWELRAFAATTEAARVSVPSADP
jgi:hypothetical protein